MCVSSSATHPPAETATPREVCHLTYRIMIMYQKFAYYLASLFFFVRVPGFGFGFGFEFGFRSLITVTGNLALDLL